MSLKRISVFFRHNLRLVLSDPQPLILYVFVPLLVMAILRPAEKIILVDEGFKDANGAEQVVPAFVVMFSFFWMRSIGENFFVEYNWGTWERLQATSATTAEIMLGKLLPAFVMIGLQNVVLFTAGALIFDLNSAATVVWLVPVSLSMILCILSLTLVLVAFCKTLAQQDAVATLSTMLFSAIGGALVPVKVLPDLAQNIAPATPAYWALKAARDVILEGKTGVHVLGPCAALLGFTVLFTALTMARFSFSEAKGAQA